MTHRGKSTPGGASELTRRVFMRTNLGRVVAGAVTLIAVNRALACYSDDAHSDSITHSNYPHSDYLDGCAHGDTPAWGDQCHSDAILHSNSC